MITTTRHIKIFFLILSIILLNFSSGCSKPVIKSDKIEGQKKEEKKKMFLERRQIVTDELKIVKDKLDEITGQINIFTAKERHSRFRFRNEQDEYKEKSDAAKIERNDLQIKYGALTNELKDIEQKLCDLGYPIEKLSPQPNENKIFLKTK